MRSTKPRQNPSFTRIALILGLTLAAYFIVTSRPFVRFLGTAVNAIMRSVKVERTPWHEPPSAPDGMGSGQAAPDAR
jgi:hypothetical protein